MLRPHLHRRLLACPTQVVSNPKDTIVFDHDRHKQILESVAKMGSDAKLHLDSQGKVCSLFMLLCLFLV